MIEFLRGKVVQKNPAFIVLDCNGIGYYINTSFYTSQQLPDNGDCQIYTHLSIKEDAHVLYGFSNDNERKLFRNLISVSGIGANTARMLLSSLNTDELENAILSSDVGRLQSVKGIGLKTAQRIVLELRDKIKKGEENLLFSTPGNSIRSEALSALVTLGFQKSASEKALDQILKREKEEITVEKLIRHALQMI